MNREINEAVDEVLIILRSLNSPRDAVEVVVRAHVQMTALCAKQVNIDTMLPAYAEAFRGLYSLELRLL